jgi:hypothetical protein
MPGARATFPARILKACISAIQDAENTARSVLCSIASGSPILDWIVADGDVVGPRSGKAFKTRGDVSECPSLGHSGAIGLSSRNDADL